jgi:hypothetical protein
MQKTPSHANTKEFVKEKINSKSFVPAKTENNKINAPKKKMAICSPSKSLKKMYGKTKPGNLPA